MQGRSLLLYHHAAFHHAVPCFPFKSLAYHLGNYTRKRPRKGSRRLGQLQWYCAVVSIDHRSCVYSFQVRRPLSSCPSSRVVHCCRFPASIIPTSLAEPLDKEQGILNNGKENFQREHTEADNVRHTVLQLVPVQRTFEQFKGGSLSHADPVLAFIFLAW